MSKACLLPALAALLALALLVAACGGDSDEDEIADVIETSVTSTDPAHCTELQTQAFTEQTNFAEGEAAVEQCEEDAADETDNPDSVDVSEIEIDGDRATANVSFVGGTFGGSTVSVALVREDDQWKLDEITDVLELDLDQFRGSIAEQAAEEADDELGRCVADELGRAGEETISELILSGDQDLLLEIVEPCLALE